MTPPDAGGRGLVLAVIVATVTVSLLVIVAFNLIRGPDRLPQQVTRFLLTVGLCVFLYRGADWACWAAGVLYFIAGVAALLGGLAHISDMAGLLLIAMGMIYLASSIILLFVPSVQAYFGADGTRTV